MIPVDRLLYLSSLSPRAQLARYELEDLLSQIRDWDELLEKAARHRLHLRLYFFLKQNAKALIPASVWKKAEAFFLRSQAHVMALEAELEHFLLPRFSQKNIPILLLKGAALFQSIYRARPIRYATDLDLLIHPENLRVSLDLLKSLGYRQAPLSHFPSRWHERELGSRLNSSFPCHHPNRGVALDLHIEAFDKIQVPSWTPGSLWKEAQLISLAGYKAFLPHPHSLFLHLFFHYAEHAARPNPSFAWLLDLDECLRFYGPQIRPKVFLEAILVDRRSERLLSVLASLKEHLATPLPAEFLQILEERSTKPLSLESLLLLPKSELTLFNDPTWIDRRERFVLYWNLVTGPRKKMWFLLRWLFPDPLYLKVKYSVRNFPGYAVAWVRHLFVVAAKGLGIVTYLANEIFGGLSAKGK